MLQNAQLVIITKLREKLRVIQHFKLSRIRIDAHTSSRDRSRGDLVNPAGERSKKRLAHQEASGVHVEIEGLFSIVSHCSFPYSYNITVSAG